MATATKKKTKAPTISDAVENDADKIKSTEYIETGDVGLDIVLTDGKGIPLGANIMLFGMPGPGKTTLLGDTVKRLLDKYEKAGLPFRIHYVDAESSLELFP